MLLRIIHVAHGSIFVNPIGPPGTNNDKIKGVGEMKPPEWKLTKIL